MKRTAADLEPVQCGLGTKGACEIIGMATGTIFRELSRLHPTKKKLGGATGGPFKGLQLRLAATYAPSIRGKVPRSRSLDGVVVLPASPLVQWPPEIAEPQRGTARG